MPGQRELSSAMRYSMGSFWLAVLVLIAFVSPAHTQALFVSTGEPIHVTGPFAVIETKAGTARGVSGLACLAPLKGIRSCLAVNDEERFAEWATFDGERLLPTGKKIQLLSQTKQQSDKIVGTMPQGICDKKDDFEEFDGEAIAIAGNKVFVVGSHACTREKGKFKPSTFVLARAEATGETLEAKDVERSWRLSDIIRNSSLSDAFGKHGTTGVGIEGMAVVGDRLFLGFRTPSVNDKATILSVEAGDLFTLGESPSGAIPSEFKLELGSNTGIRDLAALNDGRLLVLLGPADASDGTYMLHIFTPSNRKLRPLAELRTDVSGMKKEGGGAEVAKAEAIAVLDQTEDAVIILVTYDNIDDGGPRLHRISLPKD